MVLALAVTAAVASGAAGESAKARNSAGTSTITHAGQTSKVTDSTKIEEGDIIRVPADARMTIEYADGSTMTVVGPASMRQGENTPKGRRLVLASGTISEATIYGVAVEIQAPNPYDASMVLQNARGFGRVNPGDRITFEKLEGNFAKVWRDNKYTDLGANSWTLNTRDGTVTSGPPTAARRGPSKEQPAGTDGVKVTLNGREIVFHPASSFTRETTAEGGLNLTYNGAADSFGVVEVGLETTMFVAPGQSVDFDANGDVTRSDGISQGYNRLFAPFLWDEPIENAIDASPQFPHDR
jgi:hypothetical protein